VVAVIDFAMTLIDLPVKVFELFLAPSLSEIVVVAPLPNGSSSTSLATPEGADAPAPEAVAPEPTNVIVAISVFAKVNT
jgi:hypothetical protein